MMVNFNDVFHPENKWKDKKLTDFCPCGNCEVHNEYEVTKTVGSIAERQYAELPKSCDQCAKKSLWLMDCMQKLKWYEDNDKSLQTKKANAGARRYKKEKENG